MSHLIDLTGQTFNRWTVICQVEGHNGKTTWLCRCVCGTERVVLGTDLKANKSKSCGCLKREVSSKRAKIRNKTHGDSGKRLHVIWLGLSRRCYNPNEPHYNLYGGRGIKVCDEWRGNYVAFRDWALANGYDDKLTLDRIDSNGNYEPSNCRWATMKVQQNNRRNNHLLEWNGQAHNISEWAEMLNIDCRTITSRLYRGWSVEETLSVPVKTKSRKRKEHKNA